MADSGVIQEFLVNIGFKTDEQGERRYQDSIAGITKGAAVLVTSLTGAALAAATAVNKISTDLAALFYSSQSLHATAAGITALDRAFEELRGSSAEGQSAFESFASAMRENPLYKGMVEQETGKLYPEGKTEEAFVNIIDIFQKKRAALTDHGEIARLNKQFEAITKIPSSLIDAPFAKLKEAFERHKKELDPGYGKAAEDARDLRVSITELGNAFQSLAIKAAAPLFEPLKILFEWLATWVDANQDSLIDLIKQIWAEIGKAAHDLNVVFGPALRGVKLLWDALMDTIKYVTGSDNTGLKGLHLVLAGILGMVTIGAMAALAAQLTLGFAPFGVLALVLTGILATLSAINVMFGGGMGAQAATLPGGGIGAGQGGGATSLGGVGLGGRAAASAGGVGERAPGGAGIHGGGGGLGGRSAVVGAGGSRGNRAGLGGRSALRSGAGQGGGASGHTYTETNDFFDAIIKAEGTAKGGRDPYETSLNYRQSPKPLTSMTMDEVLSWGDQLRASEGLNSSAKGAFQIVNTTQRLAMKALGILGIDLFSKENQRRMASWIARTQGLSAWEGFKVHHDQLARAKAAMAQGKTSETAKDDTQPAAPAAPSAASPYESQKQPKMSAGEFERDKKYSEEFYTKRQSPRELPQGPAAPPIKKPPSSRELPQVPGAFVPQADADAWVKKHFPPAGKPLGEGKQSSLHIQDSRSVKHETSINVVGGEGRPAPKERQLDLASMLGHLQGNSA